jgi:hypothetical protein
MARLRRLECHAPMVLAVGVTGNLRPTAEAEIKLPGLTDGPAAVSALKIEERFRFAGFGELLNFLDHRARPRKRR